MAKVNLEIDEFYFHLQKDGNGIRPDAIDLSTNTETATNPFPGFRSFKTSESLFFFGREGQSDVLVKQLRSFPFLAVIGSSGTGKSSLVRAGLIPDLYSGFIHNAGDEWDIAICRPGNNPIRNLAVALTITQNVNDSIDEVKGKYSSIENILRLDTYGLIKIAESGFQKNNKTLLVIIDQFEEIFRYKRENSEEEANHFVKLLLNTVNFTKQKIYIIITMRSEYLGDCIHFRDLPEAINKGQYLVPRLTRQQLRDAITRPLIVVGKTISPILVNLLIDEVGDNMDQLPLLQHSLMSSFSLWKKDGFRSTELEKSYHDNSGGLMGALNKHADEAFNKLKGDKGNQDNFIDVDSLEFKKYSLKQRICMELFQIITDRATDRKGIRRPTELQNIYNTIDGLEVGRQKATKDKIDEVIDFLRSEETSFLMPPKYVNLSPELTIDIGHESLMRHWKRLELWIAQEATKANIYRRLDDIRLSNVNPKGIKEKLQSGLIAAIVQLKRNYNLNPYWAKKYFPDEKNILERHTKNIKFFRNGRIINGLNRGVLMAIPIAASLMLVLFMKLQLEYSKSVIERQKQDSLKIVENIVNNKKLELAKSEISKEKRKSDSLKYLREIEQKESKFAIAKERSRRKEEEDALEIAKLRLLTKNFENEKLERQNDEFLLAREVFFTNPYLGSVKRDSIVNALIGLKHKDATKYKILLKSLNSLTLLQEEAKNSVPLNPNLWLYKIKQVVDESGSKATAQLAILGALPYAYYSKEQLIEIPKRNSWENTISLSTSPNQNALVVNSTHLIRKTKNKLDTIRLIPKGKTFYSYRNQFIGFAGEDVLAFFLRDRIDFINFQGKPIRSVSLKREITKRIYLNASKITSKGDKFIYLTSKSYNVLDLNSHSISKLNIPVGRDYFLQGMNNITFSPNGKYCIIGNNYRPILLEMASLKETPIYIRNIQNVVFSGDSVVHVLPNNSLVKSELPLLKSYESLIEDVGTEASINGLVISEDNNTIVVRRENEIVYKRGDNNQWDKFIIPKSDFITIIDGEVYSITKSESNDSSSPLLFRKWEFISKPLVRKADNKFEDVFNLIGLARPKSIEIKLLGEGQSPLQNNELKGLDSIGRFSGGDFSSPELLSLYRTALKNGWVTKSRLTKFRSLSRKNFEKDSSYKQLYDDYRLIATIEETTLKDSIQNHQKSSDFGALSFYSLFVKDFQGAIQFATRGLELDSNSTNDWIVTNLALGNLLAGKLEAYKLYTEYKSKRYTDGRKKFKDAFLEDIRDLKGKKIILNSDKDVQRVIDFLKDKIPSLD